MDLSPISNPLSPTTHAADRAASATPAPTNVPVEGMKEDAAELYQKIQEAVKTRRISSEAGKTLQRLMKLLMATLELLQQSAIIQKNTTLNITQFINAYTELMGQIPLLAPSDLGINTKNPDDKKNQALWSELSALNAVASQKIDTLRGLKDVWGDAAKMSQADINTLQDMIRGLTDVLISLLDGVRSCVSSVFR